MSAATHEAGRSYRDVLRNRHFCASQARVTATGMKGRGYSG
jgi:hypothetical protein